LQQKQITMRGHAIEARIYAENPERDFMPAAGRIEYLQLPGLDADVRVDTGVRCGDDIGINYDPMIAKLIVHGSDRNEALARLSQALPQYQVLGLNTNLGFLARLASSPEFKAADFDTGFIASHHEKLFAKDDLSFNQALMLASAAMLPAFDDREASAIGCSPWDSRDQWRMNLQAHQVIKLEQAASSYAVVVDLRQDGWHFSRDDSDYLISAVWLDRQRMRLQLDNETIEFPVLRERESISLCHRGQAYQFTLCAAVHGPQGEAADADHPRAPMSGAVVALACAVGDTVEPGDTLVVVEAMKMEHSITAQVSAVVGEVLVAVGDQVDEGDTLVQLEVE
jgi:3-methylcrotonyl-CoA carboxylase alpha subunit